MDTSAISGTSSASTYVATTGGATASTDFASVLASQTFIVDPNDTSTVDAAEKGLTAYSPGQVTAYALTGGSEGAGVLTETDGATESTETTATTSASSTSEGEAAAEGEESSETSASSGAGYPAEPGSEWTPGHMQFYDEVFGRWVDDNIPHRINESGDLEYQYEGEWYLDVAVRHRILDDEGNVIAFMDESGNPIKEGAEEGLVAEGEGETTEGEAAQTYSFQVDEYFNEVLQAWKVFNFPERVNESGQREYYWADAWHVDNWQHRLGGSETQVASASEESSETTSETGSSQETTAQAA
ncbi:MAG: hypothetical protein HY910_13520 [Desulfarculus sp.]|nr:hypothetical protein [Desulfarculus sp.]